MTQSPEPRQSIFGLVGRLVNGVRNGENVSQ